MTYFRSCALFLAGVSTALIATATAQVDEGAALLAQGEARAAMIRFERAVRDDPDDTGARLGLARALLRLGEFERAEKMAQTVYRRTQDPSAAMVVAEALYALEDLGAASEALDRASDHPDADALRALVVAERALAAADPVAALQAVRPAARHDAFGTYARLLAARAQYARGDLVRAKRLVDSILTSGGETVPAMLLSAQLALRSGDDPRAKQMATRIMEADPGSVSAGSILVEVALRANDPAAARAILPTLTSREADDPRPRFLEALILLSEGRLREAGDIAATIEPWLVEAPGGAVMLAEVKIDAGRLAQAERILRERLNRSPSDRAARRMLVRVYDDTDRRDRGDLVIEEGLFHAPNDRVLMAFKADRLMARGELDAAMATLTDSGLDGDLGLLVALGLGEDRLRADDVTGLEQLLAAQAALRQRQPTAAFVAADAAAQAGVPDALVNNIRATAFALSGDPVRARSLLDDTIEAAPNFLAAIENRARLSDDGTTLRTVLENALAAGADAPDVLALLVRERYVDGDEGAALSLAQRASARAQAGTLAALVHAETLRATGDAAGSAQATLARLRAIEGQAMTPEFGRAAAQLLLDAGATDEGIDVLVAVADGGAEIEASREAAVALMDAERTDEAVSLLAMAHRTHPQNRDIAIAYLQALASRDMASAVDRLSQSETLKRFDAPATRARMAVASGDRAGALLMLDQAPASLEALFVAAEVAETLAERQRLLARAEPLAQRRPGDVALHVLVSSLAIDTGDIAKAERAIAAGLAAAPGDPILTNNLAVLRIDRQPEVAVALAERAYAALPNEAEIARTLVDAYTAVGDVTAARGISRRLRLQGDLGAPALGQSAQ